MSGVPGAMQGSPVVTALTVLVTRPEPQATQWVERLAVMGLSARALPLLEIGPAPRPDEVRACFSGLRGGELLMLVSPNAALRFVECLTPGWHWPDNVRAGATGPGTVAALLQAGVPRALIVAPSEAAGQFDSEALWALLCTESWQGRVVWVVRGDGGRDWLAQTLVAAGAAVRFVQAYGRRAPTWTAAQRAVVAAALDQPGQVRWLLSSSEALGHLAGLCPGVDWARHSAWATHPRIAEAAKALGFGQVRQIGVGVEGVREALIQADA